ncbi:hypothetical protein LCGC14_1468250 [marine sediment metagenome]|uniref:DUF3307 domain-containing protein n=1 Tax=marine sediment metagenome TaxID=412755 RepID=A0A0F9JD51_9ZZZZ
MNIFVWLLFAHFLGDFSLQGKLMGEEKQKNCIILLIHCVIWSGCVCVALQYLDILTAWKYSFLFFGHLVIDYWKIKKKKEPYDIYFYLDQVFHIIQLEIVYHF